MLHPDCLRRALALTAALAVATGPGCGGAPAPAPRPDVVLLMIDTLRADRLSSYGCPRELAPFLDDFAGRSVVFENAWSPSSWTLPATVSVLTSLHPSQHGVTSLEGLELGPDDEPLPVNRIPDGVRTLAEVLGAQGYRTLGVASNVLVGAAVGIDRGFDEFVQLMDEDADAVNAQVARWKARFDDERPWFLYVHYIDPHDTYHVREPWFDPDTSSSAAGWPASRRPDEPHPAVLAELLAGVDRLPPGLSGRRPSELAASEIDALVSWSQAAYDSEIGFLDQRLRALDALVDLEAAQVVVLADHGEAFFEHGTLRHGQDLHAESLRVPLLLHLPGAAAPRGRVATPVSTLDVLPTLRALLGLAPGATDEGHDLLAAASRGPVLGTLVAKSGQERLAGDLRSLVVGDERIVVQPDGRVALYDLARDPGEHHDLAAERPERTVTLLTELQRLEDSLRPWPRTWGQPGALDDSVREHLRGLGYLGGK